MLQCGRSHEKVSAIAALVVSPGRDNVRLGFVPPSRDGAQVLFQFISDRYDNGKSLAITTNLEFSEWTEVLHDPQMTAALLDRLTHRCHIFEHKGESYRFRESMKKKAGTKNFDGWGGS